MDASLAADSGRRWCQLAAAHRRRGIITDGTPRLGEIPLLKIIRRSGPPILVGTQPGSTALLKRPASAGRAPTEAGERLLAELPPALGGIRGAFDRIAGFRDKPRGHVRVLVPRLAVMTVLGPKVAQFARDYPDVVLDVTTNDDRLDLVAAGFDAGIQYGEFIHKDMVAVRVSRRPPPSDRGLACVFRVAPATDVAARFARASMRQLSARRRRCVPLEFDRGDESLTVAVNGPLIRRNDIPLLIRAALAGVGLALQPVGLAALIETVRV